MFYSLMLVTQKGTTPLTDYLDFIVQCVDGGITSVQIREKSISYSSLLSFAETVQRVLEPYAIPIVINDMPLLAHHIGTPYVHVGQSDSSVEDVYACIPNACIGLSIENEEEVYKANTQELAYISASAVFPSSHKDNLKRIWGLEGLQRLKSISKHPLIAIGGITLENVYSVLEYGAQGIALIGALHSAQKPYEVAKQFRNIIDSYSLE